MMQKGFPCTKGPPPFSLAFARLSGLQYCDIRAAMKSLNSVIPRVLLLAAFVLRATAADTPKYSREQQEDFLMKAKVASKKSAGRGITDSEHAILTDGALTHDAHIQCVDEHS